MTFLSAGAANEMRLDFKRLKSLCTDFCGQKTAVLLVGDGNYGDALIRYGTEIFFRDAGIRYRRLDLSKRSHKLLGLALGAFPPARSRSAFFFKGGGGWAPQCTTGLRSTRLQLRSGCEVMVLPSTFELEESASYRNVIRRDQFGSLRFAPRSEFCHDLAFYLATIPKSTWLPGTVPEIGAGVGVFFRRDNEARIKILEGESKGSDLSARGGSMTDIEGFLRTVGQHEEILTDRLHVAVAGTILGRRVSLVEGATPKIGDIFRTSIQPFFTNCALISDSEAEKILARVRS